MPTLAAGTKVYLATEPVDLRRGHDGLCSLVKNTLGLDAFAGHLYVFVGRRGDRVKVLFWDRGGFVLYYKRLAPVRRTNCNGWKGNLLSRRDGLHRAQAAPELKTVSLERFAIATGVAPRAAAALANATFTQGPIYCLPPRTGPGKNWFVAR